MQIKIELVEVSGNWTVCRLKKKKKNTSHRTQQSSIKKPDFTRTSKSGKHENAEDKERYKEMLTVTTQEVPRFIIKQMLTAVCLLLCPHSLAPVSAKNSSCNCTLKSSPSKPSHYGVIHAGVL